MHIINEQSFIQIMEEQVEPYLSTLRMIGRMENGIYFECYRPKGAKAAIVISHGFAEFAEKYREVIYYMVTNGYEVYISEHRGHARSVHPTTHRYRLHIEHFTDYVDDLHAFMEELVRPLSGEKPIYLFAHSMGGAIGALYLETYPQDFEAAVLSSPMLKINLHGIPERLATNLLGRKVKKGLSDTYAFSQHDRDSGKEYAKEIASSRERFAYGIKKRNENKQLFMGGSSRGWAYEATKAVRMIRSKEFCSKIRTPVLIFMSARDTIVLNAGTRQFAGNTKQARLIGVREASHEIYNSHNCTLARYYQMIFKFFDQNGHHLRGHEENAQETGVK